MYGYVSIAMYVYMCFCMTVLLCMAVYDCLRKHLKEIHVEASDLDERCYVRAEWRNSVQNGVKDFEKRRVERLEQKRAIRHRDVTTTATQSHFVCQQCDRDCISMIALISHERVHARRGDRR